MRPLEWQIATITDIRQETPRARTFTLSLPEYVPHRPGQHVDLRFTAEDGYQAQRSYSIASPPEWAGRIDLTVDRIADGEVSTYMHDVLVPGDLVEVRGPIGGYFTWETSQGGPLLLVGGGSGVVPLMAMIRHHQAAGSHAQARLLYSSRAYEDIIYRQELDELSARRDGFEVYYTLTRVQPPGWQGYGRRVDADMLAEMLEPHGRRGRAYLCGPTAFVEAAASELVRLGLQPMKIKTERFGPTGG